VCEEKKAEDIEAIRVEPRIQVLDYFVLVTGLNRTHIRALTNEIHLRLKAAGERHRPIEGGDLGWWVVLDFGDVAVHLMQREAREFYDLEKLYHDCPRLDWRAVGAELPASAAAKGA
jgi:ribosome-associated protein